MKHGFWIKYRRNDSVKIVKVGHTVVLYGVASRVEPRSIYLVPIGDRGIFLFPCEYFYYLGGIDHD